MESVYMLSGRIAEINTRYVELEAELEAMYEDNGGEVTEQTEEMDQKLAELEELKKEAISEIIANSDAYADLALNYKAEIAMREAELNAYKAEVDKAVKRYQAKVARATKKYEFWRDNFDAAMKMAEATKIGGAKTGLRHSIYYTTSKTIAVDEQTVMSKFQEVLDTISSALPAWIKVKTSIDKAILKKEAELPLGAEIVENSTLQIK